MNTIYLDYNSTTPIDLSVVDEMMEVYRLQHANPSSQHRAGQAARKYLEQAKSEIIGWFGGQTQGTQCDRLIVTSGGTESNNLAVIGLAKAQRRRRSRSDLDANQVFISSIEHPSLLVTAQSLEALGFQVELIPCQANGMVDIEFLSEQVSEKTCLVSLMIANHETGVIQPFEKAARCCRERDVVFHSDASQAIGKIPVHFGKSELGAMTLSPHKFYGPRGVGGLLVRHDVEFDPLLYGGSQQLAGRPGTEDIALVAGMRAAARRCDSLLEQSATLAGHRNHMEAILTESIPDLQIHGKSANRLPNTSNLSLGKIDRQALLMAADLAGIYLSTGSACASGSSEPSPVLTAMGLDPEIIAGSIRLSLGVGQSRSEIERAAAEIVQIADRLKA